MRRTAAYLRDASAATTVEFVVLFLPLIMIVFTCFQIPFSYHLLLTDQKAVENAARLAAVRDPVHTGLPVQNTPQVGAAAGDSCAIAGSCVDPGGPWVCTGADLASVDCDAAAFNVIFEEIQRTAYSVEPEDVTISYRYASLGFAGGDFVPIITVSIAERAALFQFGFDLTQGQGSGTGAQQVRTLPRVAATSIGEDLSSTN